MCMSMCVLCVRKPKEETPSHTPYLSPSLSRSVGKVAVERWGYIAEIRVSKRVCVSDRPS